MSHRDETAVAKLIGRETGLTFSGHSFPLDPWGKVDDFAPLGPDRFLLLEVETGQKHPCTNILKVWPYLEKNVQIAAVLAQVYFPDSPGRDSSRGRLGCWLAQKLETELRGRFRYARLVVASDVSGVLEGRDELLHSLKSMPVHNRFDATPPVQPASHR